MDCNINLENLKKIRLAKNYTQIKVSVEIGVSQEIISQYERGISVPTLQTLLKLADLFHCSTDYLLGRTDVPIPANSLEKDNIEYSDIINKYKSLSKENKEHLLSYLNYLNKK